jgi:hypothetical protein
MHAIAANQSIEAFLNCADGVAGFDQNPHLDHVSRFPVVRSFGEAGRDDHTMGVFVENEAVHWAPPLAMGTIERSNLVGTGFPSP